MYILIYLVVLGLLTLYTDRKNEVDTNDEFLYWTRKDASILGIFFVIALGLTLLPVPFIANLIGAAIYLVAVSIAALYCNKSREEYIQRYKQQLDQIISAITPVEKIAEVNYSELPFTITKEGSQINKIQLDIKKPESFKDERCTNIVNSLNNCFPYYEWQYSCDFQKQICTFEGKRLPPDIALWNGSDKRRSSFIPLGLAGNGEVGMRIAKGEEGESSYIYPDGQVAETTSLASAPQHLVVGATGGGKAIWTEQELW